MKKLFVVLFALFAFAAASFANAAVDLNTATEAELQTVKGIGPAKAKAIVEYRTKSGPFKSVDDLDNVKGFGKKSVDKMRGELTVGGGAAKPAAAKKEEAKPDDQKAEEKGAKKGKGKKADEKKDEDKKK